jgi:endonuclease YncB( thermonuclease family)
MEAHVIRLLFLVSALAPAIAFAGTCKVIDVSDGDTFTCYTQDDEQVKVRLAEIDAPEMNQPYGNLSKQSLYRLISSEMVKLDVQDTDQYGRSVARVKRVDGLDVNAEQIRLGAAWVYPKYLKDKSLLALETEAKTRYLGIWAQPTSDQTPPWEWRQSKQTGSASDTPVAAAPTRQSSFSQVESSVGGFNCSKQKRCGRMSCAEARYQLNQCGNPYLDGDGDGKPCEQQCGH